MVAREVNLQVGNVNTAENKDLNSGILKMKTLAELQQELRDWVKCIRFETDEKALEHYYTAYGETWLELREYYEAIIWQLN